MYNANKPNLDDLPSSAQLLKSTLIAAVSALFILLTIVLPSEYGIDPTGIGKILNLADMGGIKVQLAEEAEGDRQKELQNNLQNDKQSSLLKSVVGLFVGSAQAQTKEANWKDTISFTLAPSKGTEIKLVMEKGAVADFAWKVKGGVVNYDLHGDGRGNSISYKRARAVPSHQGTLTAKFTGNHGWFWRNRGKQDVTVTLFVRGAYSKIKR